MDSHTIGAMASQRIDAVRIRDQVGRMSSSPQFCAAGRLRAFLHFIVAETVEGREHSLKEYTIGTRVYSRGTSFDPKTDCIVRVEAIKLRARLSDYYGAEGSFDNLVISVPKGGYVPQFHNSARWLPPGASTANQVGELCDLGFLALMRRTPAAISMATSSFVQARSLNPLELMAHLGLATTYTASLDIETVSPCDIAANFEAAIKRGLELNEDSGEAHVLASLWSATVEGAGNLAIAELRRAIDLEPKSPAAHFWACGLLSAQGAHEGSLEHFRKALLCAPNCPLIQAYLARSLYYAGRNLEGLDVLRDVLDVDPGLAVGHLWTALLLTEVGRQDEAVEAALQSIQLSETSGSLGVGAFVLARAGRREEAEKILTRLSTEPPYDYVSPLQMALITDALGRREEAARHLADAGRENAWALLWADVDPRLRRLHERYR